MSRFILTISLILLLFGGATAGIIKVPENYATIQAGINAAFPGDTVLVAAGTYYENIDFKGKVITVASHFLIDGDTTHVNSTIIDGSQPGHADSGSVVYFVSGEDTNSVLCGFTITQGSGTEAAILFEGTQYLCRAGGGILCYNSGTRILNNKIIHNAVNSLDQIVFGGGLAALPFENTANVILAGNQVTHNTVTANSRHASGGGVELLCNGILANNLISYNSVIQNATDKQATSGGVDCWSLSSDSRKVIVESNKISHNSVISYSDQEYATVFAGGCCIEGYQGRFSRNEVSHNEIWIKTGKNAVGAGMEILEVANSFIIEGNIIKGNAIKNGTGWGGAAGFGGCSPHIINNIIAGNSATRGGAFFLVGSDVRFINNTIINNQASYGGALYVKDKNPVLMNSIIWNNQAATDAAIHIESGTIQVAYCDIQGGWSGTGNMNEDPKIIDNKYHLSDTSPCIDKGNPEVAYNDPEDLNNLGYALAPAKGTVRNDMGAFGGPGAGETNTAIKHERSNNEAQPNTFALFQNYPNPFNPITTIEFALPQSAFVTLKVYNLLGEEVATLVAEQRSAGIHQLNWDARGLASGVYLYRLEAGEFIKARKLIMLR